MGTVGEYDKMDETLSLMTPDVEEHRDSLLRKWHLRLGHANMALIKQMSKDQVVNAICLKNKDYDENAGCLSCVMAQMKRMPFNTRSERTNGPFRKLIVGIGPTSHANTFDGYNVIVQPLMKELDVNGYYCYVEKLKHHMQ